MLSIEKFQAPHSSISLNQLISKIFLTPKYPFKLGAKVFLLLLDLFLYHDFSFTNFVKGIKFSMIEHFFNQPLSFLCCNFEEAADCVKAMSHDQLELCRQFQSFRRYVEHQAPKEQRALLLDDKHTKGVIQDLLEVIHEYHSNFYPVLLCLHQITNELPQSPLGKKLRELYAMTLEGNIVEQEGYKQAISLVRLFAREELICHLEACIRILDKEEGILEEVCSELVEYKQTIEGLAESAHLPAKTQAVNGKEESTEEQHPSNTATTGKVTLHSLQQKLMVDAKKKKELTQYEVVRQDVIEYLQKVFRKILIIPHSLTLHEVFYFDNVYEVRQHLHASPRAAIQTALTNPYVYLQNEACKIEADSVTGSLPDICIVYKLHLEYGRLINLYDWLQAFVTVVTGQLPHEEEEKQKKGKGGKGKEKTNKETDIDPELQYP
ncbi:putative origin recognition complex subunit 3 [Apostichopus japonicus]|uniref:Origin recognition complex subunit 3 n=1 Tax=Stichopus japonicus TaxID=307972 RepID=A0A2G8LLV3_STIJA|nr:putative origin recognition complex subunit 3 [Apostichopus japonicus]